MALEGQETELDTTGLSAAEIAALEDEEDSEDAEAYRKVAELGDDDDDEGEEEDDDGADDDENQDKDDGNATESADDDAVDPTDTAEEDAATIAEFAPMQAVYAVEGYDEKIAAFQTQKAELRAKLNDGEIDIDAYEQQKEDISQKELALRLQQATAEAAARQNEHIAKERWNWEQERFFNDPANALYKNKIIGAALNATVIDLANDPKNESRNGEWFLKEADRLVRESFGQAAPAKGRSDQARKPDLSKVPKTLGGLPIAETNDTGSDEFAHLDKLSGMDLEKALAKMSQDQVDRYLSAQ